MAGYFRAGHVGNSLVGENQAVRRLLRAALSLALAVPGLGFAAAGAATNGTTANDANKSGGATGQRPIILVLGDSLSEGYGVEESEAYPARLQVLLDKEGFVYQVKSASVSGSTTASGPSRLRWFLKEKPSILLLALGANDGLRGLKLEETEKNLSETVDLAKKEGVSVVLAGMQLPPNYGEEYTGPFRQLFERLAARHGISLIPFLLEGVGGVKGLNLPDGIHPNASGHEKIAATVLAGIKHLLDKAQKPSKLSSETGGRQQGNEQGIDRAGPESGKK